MESSLENPLGFFDWYLDNQINTDLKEFYYHITEELYHNNSEVVDKQNHVIKAQNIYNLGDSKSEYITFSFEHHIKAKLKQEIRITINLIEQGIQNRFSDKNEVSAYANFLRIKITRLLDSATCNNYPFLISYFEQLESLIDRYSKQPTNYSYTPSFNLIAESPKEQLSKIKKLYKLLIAAPAMIDGSQNDFIKAFKGKEIDGGINWLVKGKNKNFVSKPSLLYFLDELIDKKHLSRNIIHDLYKYIRYVFRDHNGNELKYLKQSREAMSDNPANKDRIDEIISSL